MPTSHLHHRRCGGGNEVRFVGVVYGCVWVRAWCVRVDMSREAGVRRQGTGPG